MSHRSIQELLSRRPDSHGFLKGELGHHYQFLF
nr:MAG TPA: hypothetical protein [Caudoviricetes sp.]